MTILYSRKKPFLLKVIHCIVIALMTFLVHANEAFSQAVTQRHETGKSVANAVQSIAIALNKAAVAHAMNRHVKIREKTARIASTLREKPHQGILLEGTVYKQKYGDGKLFWSADVIGVGNTPLQVLTEYAKKAHIQAIPSKGWELDTSATTYYWYTLGEAGKLKRTRIRGLINSVKKSLEKEKKEMDSMTKRRKKEIEMEMNRQLSLRELRVKETAQEVGAWLKKYRYKSTEEWADKGLQDALRAERLMRNSLRSGRRLNNPTFNSPVVPSTTQEPMSNIPLTLDSFLKSPSPDALPDADSGVPVHLD